MASSTRSCACASRPLVGSSRSSTGCCVAMARASAIHCLSPPETARPPAPRRAPSSEPCQVRRAHRVERHAQCPRPARPSRRSRPACPPAAARPAAPRRRDARRPRRAPRPGSALRRPRRRSPADSRPSSVRSSVVLPMPVGPAMATTEPGSTRSDSGLASPALQAQVAQLEERGGPGRLARPGAGRMRFRRVGGRSDDAPAARSYAASARASARRASASSRSGR